MKTLHSALLLVAATFLIVSLAGCSSSATQKYVPGSGPLPPVEDSTKYSIENTEKFVLMDAAVQNSVTCTGEQTRTTADGRLEVVANVKNREGRRIQVQISCVFKDAQHFSTGDETPWQTLILTENATEAVRFTATNPLSKTYTIRVRQAR